MIVHEQHGCRPPRGALYMAGTIWRCDECGQAWFRNCTHAANVYPLWAPVMWWHFRKRRLLAQGGK